MGIKVYHGKDFRAMNNARFGGPALNFPKDFHHVATVDVADEDMHLVFEATNSIDRGWWENANVTAHTDSPAFREHNGVKGTRSTSVGDYLQLSDGRIFKCADIGWELDSFPCELAPLTGAAAVLDHLANVCVRHEDGSLTLGTYEVEMIEKALAETKAEAKSASHPNDFSTGRQACVISPEGN